MKKHVAGFLFFSLIVLGFVVGFALIARFSSSKFEIVEVEQPVDKYISVKVPKKYQATLGNLIYDEEKKEFTGSVEVKWDGTPPKPDKVSLIIGLTTTSNPGLENELNSEWIKDPFKLGTIFTKEIHWKQPYFKQLFREDNYFAFAEIADSYNDAGVVKLVYIERNYLINAVPIVIKHKRN